MNRASQDGVRVNMLDVENLRVEFATAGGIVHAVNDVSFHVGYGEIVGIVGESGCGKSVTTRAVLGLVAPPGRIVAGRAVFKGRDLMSIGKRKLRQVRGKEIGFVAQNPFGILNPVLRVGKQFHAVAKAHDRRATKATVRARALELLNAVGIVDAERVLDGYAHELSGGMAQRVGIAISMLLHPALILADEPTTALDVTVQKQILDLIRRLMREEGRDMSMLLVTHDLGVVAQYCDRVVVLYAGKVVEAGPVDEVFERPTHPYTQALLQAVPRMGRPLVNLKGRLPDLVHYPVGCPFRERCAFALPECSTEEPQMMPVGSRGSERSCFRPVGEVVAHDAVRAG